MAITRRDFLKISAGASAGILFGIFDLKPIIAYAQANPPVWTSEAISVCGYCSVGCSMIVGSQLIGGKPYITYVQGNPDSPINKGSLCSKGSASAQFSTIVSDDTGTRIPNPKRLIAVKHRAPYASDWDTAYITMDQAISMIAEKVKSTRDTTFVETDIKPEGILTVNRCEGIASLGAAAFNNEAAYLITKLMRSIGTVYLEHQARV
ncbi:MAG: twin-arginine translocation signal domain-containing protein [Nitrospirota bacterium]